MPDPLPTAFGELLRAYRVRVGMSQNQLARRSGVDPAYVNRLERASANTESGPTRKVVVALWSTLVAESAESRDPLTVVDLDRLLAAAGMLPETVRQAGGWDAYLARIRGVLVNVYGDLEDAIRG